MFQPFLLNALATDRYSRFPYAMLVAVDANFRLKEQMVSSYTVDPGLGDGLSYFVTRPEYRKFILSRTSDANVSVSKGGVY